MKYLPEDTGTKITPPWYQLHNYIPLALQGSFFLEETADHISQFLGAVGEFKDYVGMLKIFYHLSFAC